MKQDKTFLKDWMKSEEAPIQYTNYDCHRICESRHNGNFLEGICKAGCNVTNVIPERDCPGFCVKKCWSPFSIDTKCQRECYNECSAQNSPSHSPQPAVNDVKNTLENIGDGFYTLASLTDLSVL